MVDHVLGRKDVGYEAATSAIYWSSRRRFGGPWSGPIKAALKRRNCPAVTPGATVTLSAASASLFLRRDSAAFSSSFLHAAMNLRLPSVTISNHLPGSNAAVLHPSLPPIPNIRRSSATQSVHSFSLPPRPRRPGISSAPAMIRLGKRRSSTRMSAPPHNNLLVRTVVSILSQPVRWRARSYERVRWSRDLHQAPRIRSSIL